MSYMWQDFNIKTFPAETIIFRDGVFCPELSTLDSPVIDKKYDLPVHIIYVGNISGKNKLDIIINENIENQIIYLSGKLKVNKNAELKVSIKNSGFGSDLRGFFIIENHGNIDFDLSAHHLCRNTGIFIKTKILGYKNSISKLIGMAYIYKYCEKARSDIGFSALLEQDAKLVFSPVQKISAIPENAEHSANIAYYTQPQIEYLHESGLNDAQVSDILREAFMNDIDIFGK